VELLTRTIKGLIHFSRTEVCNTLKAYKMLYKELHVLVKKGKIIND